VRGGRRAPTSRYVVGGRALGVRGASRLPRDLRVLAREAARRAGRPVEIEVLVVSDPEIRRINRRWMGDGSATDVISFPLSGSDDPILRGSLAVSRDTARREAARRGHSPYHEWMLYVVHGTLHLLGHDDLRARDRARMRRAEADVLAAIGLPHVYGSEDAR
jgi:probable rRNA maturation factor